MKSGVMVYHLLSSTFMVSECDNTKPHFWAGVQWLGGQQRGDVHYAFPQMQ